MAKVQLTENGSHRATATGAGPGGIVEPGRVVPPGIPVGSWMEPIEKPKPAPKPKADDKAE